MDAENVMTARRLCSIFRAVLCSARVLFILKQRENIVYLESIVEYWVSGTTVLAIIDKIQSKVLHHASNEVSQKSKEVDKF